MIKKFLKIFSFILLIILISRANAISKKNNLKVSVIDIDYSLFYINPNGEETIDSNFYDRNIMLHPPVLVEYYQKKSVLFFLPPVKDSDERQGLILNYNLGNNKMNVVGFVHGINQQILSVFGYEFSDNDATILVLTKDNKNKGGVIHYSTFTNSIILEGNGLYIKQFHEDKISNPDLTNCIEGGIDSLGNKQRCRYKDAVSIKKFFDNRANNQH